MFVIPAQAGIHAVQSQTNFLNPASQAYSAE